MQFWAALNRTVGNVAAGYVSALVAGRRDVALSFGLKIGLTIGGVTLAGGSCTPLIEWMADRMPERRMGVVGVGLILVGFSLQSVQYWFALLDVAVR
jgi:hypothetical protein